MALGKEKLRLSADLRLSLRPVLRDVDLTLVSEENGYLGGEYGVKAIPHMIIIGRDGRIAAVHDGYGEREFPRLVKEINELWSRSSNSVTAAETVSETPGALESKADRE